MYCIQIKEEVLLKNVLGCPEIKQLKSGKISVSTIGKCGIYLENNLPGYVECQTDEQILSTAARFQGYFVDDSAQIDFRNLSINRESCNDIYPRQWAAQIEKIVDIFFKEQLYDDNRKIYRTKYVCGH